MDNSEIDLITVNENNNIPSDEDDKNINGYYHSEFDFVKSGSPKRGAKISGLLINYNRNKATFILTLNS